MEGNKMILEYGKRYIRRDGMITGIIRSTVGMQCSALVDALAEVLPHHALACVSGLNLHDKPWLFDVDANDSPLITPESCVCSTNSKYLRAILPANHPKGFSQNTPAQDNNNQTN
jgi:hypothetical protein